MRVVRLAGNNSSNLLQGASLKKDLPHMTTVKTAVQRPIVLGLATSLALSFVAIPTAQAESSTPIYDCLHAGNVWVHVEYNGRPDRNEEVKESEGGCATEFGSGLEALKSAGFAAKGNGKEGAGFIDEINDVYVDFSDISGWIDDDAINVCPFWSYWNGTVSDQGHISYTFSDTGAGESTPEPGTIEVWKVINFDFQTPEEPDLIPPLDDPEYTPALTTIGVPAPEAPNDAPEKKQDGLSSAATMALVSIAAILGITGLVASALTTAVNLGFISIPVQIQRFFTTIMLK